MPNDTQTEQSPESVAAQRRENLQDLPPSCKLVFYALRQAGEPLNVQQLAEETLLSRRTIRYALRRLSNHDIVGTRPSLRDARTTKYLLHEIPSTTNDAN
jgi:DNA-binding MarR family transcriptional regulator